MPWYQAYNDIKHDRDGQFARATLRSAIEAVLASVVMAVAQFGLGRALGDGALLIANYTFVEVPMWEVGEIYTADYDAAGWQSVDFAFASAEKLAGNS